MSTPTHGSSWGWIVYCALCYAWMLYALAFLAYHTHFMGFGLHGDSHRQPVCLQYYPGEQYIPCLKAHHAYDEQFQATGGMRTVPKEEQP